MSNYYVTPTGAGNNSGDSWANAMAISDFETAIEAASYAGDYFYFAGGTYTLSSAIYTTYDGSEDLPVSLIGVKSGTTNEPPIASDWATGTDRPLIDCTASYYFRVNDWYDVRNIRFTGAYTTFTAGFGTSFIKNCSFANTGSGDAVNVYKNNCFFIDCEVTEAGDYGIDAGAYDFQAIGCYIHDCVTGTGDQCALNNCIIADCTNGVEVADSNMINNCTIYNCTNGIYDPNGYFWSFRVMNTTISGCTNGFNADKSGTVSKTFYFDYNNWYGNTKDMSWDNGSTEDNSLKGDNDISVDPAFTAAGSDDFSLPLTSSLIDAGYDISLGVG